VFIMETKVNKNKQTLLILRGIPCSGKSTYAKELVRNGKGQWKRINRDDLRSMVDNKWTPEKEKFIIEARDGLIVTALGLGYNVVCDDTNLGEKDVEKFEDLLYSEFFATDYVDIQTKWFPISTDSAIEMDSRRENSVGKDVILRMVEKYQKAGGPPVCEAEEKEIYYVNKDLPKCIICDLDNTLADMKNIRGPHEQWKCDKDNVNESVLAVLKRFDMDDRTTAADIPIILFSGRFEQYRPQTLSFLRKYNVPYDELYMRKDDDYRKDSIVKREMFFEYIDKKYYPLFIMEDRDQCVELWRSLGLSCFQVNWGNF
jgi:predicted kinase